MEVYKMTLKETSGYQEFVKDVLVKLEDDNIRKNTDSVCSILETYFQKSRLSIYTFVHEYYREHPDKISVILDALTKAVQKLTYDYEHNYCRRYAEESNHYGLIGAFSCDQVCPFNADEPVYECPNQLRRYHVIRRITKFYENVQSVQRIIIQLKSFKELSTDLKQDFEQDFMTRIEETKLGLENLFLQVANEQEKQVKETEKQTKKLERDFFTHLIAVMSMFASAIFAILLPTQFLNAIAKEALAQSQSGYAFPALIISISMMVMFNLIYFFVSFIASIIFRRDYKEQFKIYSVIAWIVNGILLVLIGVFMKLVFF